MSYTYRVVVTDRRTDDLTIEAGVLAGIGAELVLAKGDAAAVVEQMSTADALLNTWLPIDSALVGQLQQCRIIARYGVGTDNIDVASASAAGIVVTNVPDYCVEEVATHALTTMLMLLRRVADAESRVRAGRWGIDGLGPIPRVSDLTVGLVGFGRIAQKLTTLLSPFGCRVVVHDPYITESRELPKLLSLKDLLIEADVVSLHVPYNPETRHLIGSRELRLMKPTALLVNTARGNVVELEALLDALRNGRLGGASLDAFEREPLDPKLVEGVPNLIVTPHMAYYSEAASCEAREKAATQVLKVLSGQPPDYAVAAST